MMNAATARNLTLDETINALEFAWAFPFSEEVQGILMANLLEGAGEDSDAQREIEIIESDPEGVLVDLVNLKESLAAKGKGKKAR